MISTCRPTSSGLSIAVVTCSLLQLEYYSYLAVRNGRIKHVKSDDGIRNDEEETPDARAKFRPGPQILREINKKKEIGERLHISRRPLCIDLHSL
jgi:hypothetical protein